MSVTGYIYHRLSCLGRRRGFGVQSPNDYDLIRYVLCERWPYYSYRSLRQLCREKGWGRGVNRCGRLLFRLANHIGTGNVFLGTHHDEAFSTFIHQGCSRLTRTSDIADARLIVAEPTVVMPLPCHHGATTVVINPHADPTAESAWQQLLSNPEVGTTFDLYYAAVALTDIERAAHHYKL